MRDLPYTPDATEHKPAATLRDMPAPGYNLTGKAA